MLPQLTHLEENVGAVVDEEDERADPPEVDGPGAHHEADRRHVVDEHLPKNQTIYLAAKIRISQIRLDWDMDYLIQGHKRAVSAFGDVCWKVDGNTKLRN